MPFKLKNPTAPIPVEPASRAAALTPEEAEALREADTGPYNALRTLIGELSPPVEAAAREAAAAAVQAVSATPEFAILRGAGAGVKEAWTAFEAERRAAVRDENLSARGRDDATARIAAKRDAAIERIARTVLSDTGDGLLARFPPTPVAVLPADVAATATFIVSSASSVLPEALLQKATDALRLATDPTTAPAEAYRVNLLLAEAFGPLLARFAVSPPRHWTRWAPLAAELAELIERHIDTTWGRPASRVAVGAVAAFRQDFTFICGMAREANGWDDVILTGATSFRGA